MSEKYKNILITQVSQVLAKICDSLDQIDAALPDDPNLRNEVPQDFIFNLICNLLWSYIMNYDIKVSEKFLDDLFFNLKCVLIKKHQTDREGCLLIKKYIQQLYEEE